MPSTHFDSRQRMSTPSHHPTARPASRGRAPRGKREHAGHFFGSETANTATEARNPRENRGYSFGGSDAAQGTVVGLQYFRARYYSAKQGRFISRDPLTYIDGAGLYSAYFAPNQLDPKGTCKVKCCGGVAKRVCNERWGKWKCCGGKWYRAHKGGKGNIACCGNVLYDKRTQCCEGSVVDKVEIQVCRGRLGGDGSPVPVVGIISHSYIICPDGSKFGKHPRPFGDEGNFASGPGYVNAENDRDPSKAKCKPKLVCPADAKRMCQEGSTGSSYNMATDNCHSWANCETK